MDQQRSSTPNVDQSRQAQEDDDFFKKLKLQAQFTNVDVSDLDTIMRFRQHSQHLQKVTSLIELITTQQLNQLKLMVKPSPHIQSSLLSVLSLFSGIDPDVFTNSMRDRKDIQWKEIQEILKAPNKLISLIRKYEKYLYEGLIRETNVLASQALLPNDNQEQIHPTAQKLYLLAQAAQNCFYEYVDYKQQDDAILIHDESAESNPNVNQFDAEDSHQIITDQEEIIELRNEKLDTTPEPLPERVLREEKPFQKSDQKQEQPRQDRSSRVASPPVKLEKTVKKTRKTISQQKNTKKPQVKKPVEKNEKNERQSRQLYQSNYSSVNNTNQSTTNVNRSRSPLALRVKSPPTKVVQQSLIESPEVLRDRIHTESKELQRLSARESEFKWQVEREVKKVQEWINKDMERKEYTFQRSQVNVNHNLKSKRSQRLDEEKTKRQKIEDNENKRFVFELSNQNNRKFQENENPEYLRYLNEYANKYLSDEESKQDDIRQLKNQLSYISKELQQRSESLGQIKQNAKQYPEKAPFKETKLLNNIY